MPFFDRWKEDNEPRYSQKQVNKIIEETIKSCVVNRIIQRHKTGTIVMQILSIHRLPDGTIIYVQ